MVGRLQDSLRGVTFVDLDGTLIPANSMHIFMKRLPGMLISRGAIGGAVSTLWWITLRSLRLTSHRKMKWHLTATARRHLQDSDWDRLAKRLVRICDPSVENYISLRRQRNCLIYIATAAPEEYTEALRSLLGYDGVLSTRFTENKEDYRELSGEAKHEAIEALLESENLRFESFLTDHTDDLPTAKQYPKLTILVGANKKTAREFREAGITRYINRYD